MLNIIKYENRKLYCKEVKGYVALNFVMHQIKFGQPFTVTEYVTGKDITQRVSLLALATCGTDEDIQKQSLQAG